MKPTFGGHKKKPKLRLKRGSNKPKLKLKLKGKPRLNRKRGKPKFQGKARHEVRQSPFRTLTQINVLRRARGLSQLMEDGKEVAWPDWIDVRKIRLPNGVVLLTGRIKTPRPKLKVKSPAPQVHQSGRLRLRGPKGRTAPVVAGHSKPILKRREGLRELHAHQAAQVAWGRKHGYYPKLKSKRK
jgi:hypothetical protein